MNGLAQVLVIVLGVGYLLCLCDIADELRRIRRSMQEWKSDRKW